MANRLRLSTTHLLFLNRMRSFSLWQTDGAFIATLSCCLLLAATGLAQETSPSRAQQQSEKAQTEKAQAGKKQVGKSQTRSEKIDFARQVQPIFREHCFECHAGDNQESGLNLAIKAKALRGGEHGPLLKAGSAAQSPLFERLISSDPEQRMPPGDVPLLGREIAIVRTWIEQGAVWPEKTDIANPKLERGRRHWAFQPLRKIESPKLTNWGATEIDAFIARKLKTEQLEPSKPAEARTLIRRLYFDLTGLPPSPQQADAFVQAAAKNRKEAIQDIADELLASPHYGERWARHWLDVVRYTDSDGQEADRDRPQAYRFRDFIIRAFNNDLPYDQLVRWQIAGDEYEPDNLDAVVATGFLTAGPNTVLADTFLEEERLRNRYNELDDVVSTLGSSMLALTVGCARCHDHRFDAVTSKEYYQLVSAFHSGNRHKGKLPGGGQGLYFKDFGKTPKKTWLFERGDFYDRDREVSLGFPQVLTRGKSANAYWSEAREKLKTESTGQRRALASWMTDTQHGAGPLLARVIVNRVWQHHFGYGLVRTSSDFGARGERPSHPELLEWLAQDFVAHGWKFKRLHRQIITSAVYQQDVQNDQTKQTVDPSNRLLWRMAPRRLEAEILRDAMLAVSGVLNEKRFGPGFKPPIPAEAILARNLKDGGYPKNIQESEETRRRSVYMFHKRLVPYPLFQAFDRPDLLQSCARRDNTIVAPQALALLNDAFVRARAADFAKRLLKESGDDDASLVRLAFRHALARDPNETESSASQEFIAAQLQSRGRRGASRAESRLSAVTDFCQSLFGLNEFIYVD